MTVLWANNASALLAAPVGLGDTAITLQTGTGALFPSPTGADYFYLTLSTTIAVEIVKCTSRTGDVLTVTRAQDGTSAITCTAGDKAELRVTRAGLQELKPQTATTLEMQQGTETALRSLSPALVNDAIQALAPVPQAVQAAYGNATLTGATSLFSIADGGTYTLPDFQGLPGFSVVSAANATALPAEVTTSDGWKVATGFSVGTSKLLTTPTANTAHGTWLNQLMTPPLVSTISTSGGNTDQAGQMVSSCDLGNILVFMIVFEYSTANNSNIVFVAYDKTTGLCGSALTFSGGKNAAGMMSMQGIGTNKVFAYFGTSSTRSAMVLTVDVTTLSITNGTVLTPSNLWVDHPVKLSDSAFLVCTNTQVAVVTISGTTVIEGTYTALAATTNGIVRIAARDASSAIVIYNGSVGTATTRPLFARELAISGSTITPGAPFQIGGAVHVETNARGICRVANDLYAIVTDSASGLLVYTLQSLGSGNFSAAAALVIGGSTPTSYRSPSKYQTAMPIVTSSVLSVKDVFFALSPSRLLVMGSTAIYLVSIVAGSQPAIIAQVAVLNPVALVQQADNLSRWYIVTNSPTYSEIVWTESSLSLSTPIAGAPFVIASETKNSTAVKYGSTWFAWTLPPAVCAVTPNKWIFNLTAINLSLRGEIV